MYDKPDGLLKSKALSASQEELFYYLCIASLEVSALGKLQ